jgi:hypothetical protein
MTTAAAIDRLVHHSCVWQLYSAHFGSLIWPTSKLLIL